MSELGHIPVLPAEVEALLAPAPGSVYLDCTAGLGGHARRIAPLVGPSGTVILNDLDPANLSRARTLVENTPDPPRLVTLQGNFADAPRKLAQLGLAADMVLADLGFSSTQVEDAQRGLSFMRDGPLDMRFDPSGPLTAAQLVNTLPEAELAEIIRDLGEERQWRRITQRIIDERARSPISTTSRLASIVRDVLGGKGHDRIDPATRTFQALRIAVNDELGSLRSLLESVARTAALLAGASPRSGTAHWLAPGARVAIISFHSLEDRLVKQTFSELAHRGIARSLTNKPQEATPEEQATNPRSRSAKIRAIRLTVDNAGVRE